MKKVTPPLLALSVIALSTACTQGPVKVVNKGNQYFGRQYAGTTDLPQPDYRLEKPSVAAAVASVSAKELSAPTPSDLTIQAAAPVTSAPLTEPVATTQAKPKPLQTFSFSATNTPAKPRITETAAHSSTVEPMALQPLTLPDSIAASTEPVTATNTNFIWPVEGKIVSHFGPKKNGLVNDGINIKAPEGEPIWAAATGEVVYAGNELKGYGNMMILRHNGGWMTAYAHTSDMLVTKGDRVKQGDLIGYVGKSGGIANPQLHFGIREGKKPVNPENYLPKRLASAQ